MTRNKFYSLILCLVLLGCGTAGAEEAESLFVYPNIPLEMIPGEVYALEKAPAAWESDAPEVAEIENGCIVARNEGFATLTLTGDDGLDTLYDVTVDRNAVPVLIRSAIDLALSEWETYRGKTFTDRNKYTAWYCGNGAGCHFGWCGGFVSYCLDTAGVPMDDYTESYPHEGGVPYAVFAAGVGKLLRGYTKMDRLSTVPRPGYLVIYGEKGGYATLHTGMVTDVADRGDGTYTVTTVEGNMSSRIKRYCYVYDSTVTDGLNYFDLPEEERTEEDIDQYTIHQKNWVITTFCATWLPAET